MRNKILAIIFLVFAMGVTSFGQTINHKFPNRVKYRRVAEKPFNSYNKYYPGFKKVYVRRYAPPYLGSQQLYRPYLGPNTGGVIYSSPNYYVIFR